MRILVEKKDEKKALNFVQIAAEISSAANGGKNDEAIELLKQLITAGKEQKLFIDKPINIVHKLMEVLESPIVQSPSQLRTLLLEALHLYLDLTVLETFKNENAKFSTEIKIDQDRKQRYLKLFEILSGSVDNVEKLTESIDKSKLKERYEYECARNALILLPDTQSVFDTVLKVFSTIAKLFTHHDIGGAIQQIRNLLLEKVDIWYADVLYIRKLTPQAQQSIKNFHELQKLIAEVSIYTCGHWQIAYAAQEAIYEIIENARLNIIQMIAFFGNHLEKADPSQGEPCLRSFANRAFKHSSGSHESLYHARFVEALLDLRNSTTPWIRREANSIYDEAYAQDASVPKDKAKQVLTLKTRPLIPWVELQESKLSLQSPVTPPVRTDSVNETVNEIKKHVSDLKIQKGTLKPSYFHCNSFLNYNTQRQLQTDEIIEFMPLLHSVAFDYLTQQELKVVKQLYQRMEESLDQLTINQQINYFVNVGDNYIKASYSLIASEYYLRALTLAERQISKSESYKSTIEVLQNRLSLTNSFELFRTYYPILQDRIFMMKSDLDINVEKLTPLLLSMAPVVDHLIQNTLLDEVEILYKLVNEWSLHYSKEIILKPISNLRGENIKDGIVKLLQNVKPILEQWLRHGQYDLAEPCYQEFSTSYTRANQAGFTFPDDVQESINFGIAKCASRKKPQLLMQNTWYKKRLELQNYLRQLESEVLKSHFDVKQHRNYSQKIFLWLQQNLMDLQNLLGEPPCEFAILTMGEFAEASFYPGDSIEFILLLGADFYRHNSYFQALTQMIAMMINGLGDQSLRIDISRLTTDVTTQDIATHEQLFGTPATLVKRFIKKYEKDEKDKKHEKDNSALIPLYRATCLYSSRGGKELFNAFQRETNEKLDEVTLYDFPPILFDMSTSMVEKNPTHSCLVRGWLAEKYLRYFQINLESYLKQYKPITKSSGDKTKSDKVSRGDITNILNVINAWFYGVATALAFPLNGQEDSLILCNDKLRRLHYITPGFADNLIEAITELRHQKLVTHIRMVNQLPLEYKDSPSYSRTRFELLLNDLVVPLYFSRRAWIWSMNPKFGINPLVYQFNQLSETFSKLGSFKESVG